MHWLLTSSKYHLFCNQGCGHGVHAACLGSYVRHRISERDVLRLPCPKCPRPILLTEVRASLAHKYSAGQVPISAAPEAASENTPAAEAFESEMSEFEWLLEDATLREDPLVRWCVNPRCGAPVTDPESDESDDEGGGGTFFFSRFLTKRRFATLGRLGSQSMAMMCAAALGSFFPVVWHLRAGKCFVLMKPNQNCVVSPMSQRSTRTTHKYI